MPADGKKEPLEDLKDKFRSLFGLKDPQKKKDALPPKARFSIWYFLIAFFAISYLQQYYLSSKEDLRKMLTESTPGMATSSARQSSE